MKSSISTPFAHASAHHCSLCREQRFCRYWDSQLAALPSTGGWLCAACVGFVRVAEEELGAIGFDKCVREPHGKG